MTVDAARRTRRRAPAKSAAPESDEFKQYMRKLKEFVTAFDFVRMRPDSGVIAGGMPEGSISRAINTRDCSPPEKRLKGLSSWSALKRNLVAQLATWIWLPL
jgi:hypothetical protein